MDKRKRSRKYSICGYINTPSFNCHITFLPIILLILLPQTWVYVKRNLDAPLFLKMVLIDIHKSRIAHSLEKFDNSFSPVVSFAVWFGSHIAWITGLPTAPSRWGEIVISRCATARSWFTFWHRLITVHIKRH